MPYPNWTNEERIQHHLLPYKLPSGAYVIDELAWNGYCSVCGVQIGLTAGIGRPAAALLSGNAVHVVANSFDSHDCMYEINRPLNEFDMVYPKEKKFIPTSAEDLYYGLFGK